MANSVALSLPIWLAVARSPPGARENDFVIGQRKSAINDCSFSGFFRIFGFRSGAVSTSNTAGSLSDFSKSLVILKWEALDVYVNVVIYRVICFCRSCTSPFATRVCHKLAQEIELFSRFERK